LNCDAPETAEGTSLHDGPIPGSSSQPFTILQAHSCKDVQSAVKTLIAEFVQQDEGRCIDCRTFISSDTISISEFLPAITKQKAGHALAPDDKGDSKLIRKKSIVPESVMRFLRNYEASRYEREYAGDKTLLVEIPVLEDITLAVLNELTLLLA
jgi:hypothetical protein